MTIRISILFHNRLLRDSIARILGKRADFDVISALPCEPDTFGAEPSDPRPDVLLLDSLEFLRDSERWAGNGYSNPPRRPLLLAMEDDPARFLRAVRGGARGYILQDASAADVVTAVRAVAEGQAVCPPHFIRILFDYLASHVDDRPSAHRRERWGLTRREQQLIPLIERGLSNKEIAGHFHLSEQTVKNHVHRILRKTGASGRLSIGDACRHSFSLTGIDSSVRSKIEADRAPS